MELISIMNDDEEKIVSLKDTRTGEIGAAFETPSGIRWYGEADDGSDDKFITMEELNKYYVII